MQVLDVIVSLAAYGTRPKWAISYSWCSIVMQNSRRIAGHTGQVPRFLHAFGYVLIATVMGASFLRTAMAATNDVHSPVEDIAALANSALMLTVIEGPFIMGTARTSHGPFSLDLQYDDTEHTTRCIAQRRIAEVLVEAVGASWRCAWRTASSIGDG